MAQPDQLNLTSVSYDSDNEMGRLNFTGWRGGKPFNCHCSFHVATPGDLPESEVKAAVKREGAKFFSDLAGLL